MSLTDVHWFAANGFAVESIEGFFGVLFIVVVDEGVLRLLIGKRTSKGTGLGQGRKDRDGNGRGRRGRSACTL